jgi:TonB family protein
MVDTLLAGTGFNPRAILWTVLSHIIILLLCWWLYYPLPVQTDPMIEMGMEVNLGTSEDGSGDDQPMSIQDPAPDMASAAYKSAAQQTSASNDMMTTDEADAPVVNNPTTSRTVNPNNTRVTTPNRTRQNATDNNTNRPQRPRYVYSGATGPGGNSASENHTGTSQGNTTGPGDRGVPGGTPGADNYTGSPGSGTGGIGHNLSGRNINPRSFAAEFREGGRVIVRVTVNRDGQIVSKTIKSSPSADLSRIALQKLSQAKFDRKPDAAPEQIGEVTFNFKAR